MSPDPYISRDEFATYIANYAARLERVEKLCFEDERDESGRIVRPSLETIMLRLDRHISVMCDYARLAKVFIVAAPIILGALKFLGYI